MQNRQLAHDYIKRAEARLKAINILMQEKSWADVVRGSQEIVELTLKALLRVCGIEPPRIHDVSAVIVSERNRMPPALSGELDRLAQISRTLRRDRELAFYGSEDLTPSEFYSIDDATKAATDAQFTVKTVKPFIKA